MMSSSFNWWEEVNRLPLQFPVSVFFVTLKESFLMLVLTNVMQSTVVVGFIHTIDPIAIEAYGTHS